MSTASQRQRCRPSGSLTCPCQATARPEQPAAGGSGEVACMLPGVPAPAPPAISAAEVPSLPKTSALRAAQQRPVAHVARPASVQYRPSYSQSQRVQHAHLVESEREPGTRQTVPATLAVIPTVCCTRWPRLAPRLITAARSGTKSRADQVLLAEIAQFTPLSPLLLGVVVLCIGMDVAQHSTTHAALVLFLVKLDCLKCMSKTV